jgi:hypothetical protein
MLCQYPLFAGQLTLDITAGPELQHYSLRYAFDYVHLRSDTVRTVVLEDYTQNNSSGEIGITPGYMINDRVKLSLAIEHRFQKPTTTWRMQSFIAPRITLFAPNKQPLSVSVDFGYCAWYNTVKNDFYLTSDNQSLGYSISIDYYLRRYLALLCVAHHAVYNKVTEYQPGGSEISSTLRYRKEAVSVGLRLSYNVLHLMKNN